MLHGIVEEPFLKCLAPFFPTCHLYPIFFDAINAHPVFTNFAHNKCHTISVSQSGQGFPIQRSSLIVQSVELQLGGLRAVMLGVLSH